MTRTELINGLIQKNNYKSYLEIGVNTPAQPGYNWIGVDIPTKHGVDPNVDTTYKMTSDEFFEKHISQKYDIIFVDGLHLHEQVYKDITNSLNFLNENGIIVVHDCNPVTEITQRRERASDAWHGDVWKAIVQLKIENKDMGYNAATGDIVNMIDVGIIDPARVTRTALENAVSVANTFLTLDAVVVEWEEENHKY